MKIVTLIIVVCLFVLTGCLGDSFEFDKEDKFDVKTIEYNGLRIEKYSYSSAFSESSPTYIVSQYKKETDTICISTNVKDMVLINDTLILKFSGHPKLYDKKIRIAENTLKNLQIKVDTIIR